MTLLLGAAVFLVFVLFLVCGVVGWFVALGIAVWKTVKGEQPPLDRRGIEQDSAGLF